MQQTCTKFESPCDIISSRGTIMWMWDCTFCLLLSWQSPARYMKCRHDGTIFRWRHQVLECSNNMHKFQNLPRKCKNDSSKIIIIFFRDTWTTCFGNRQLLSKLSITIQILLHQLHVRILTSIVIVHGLFELYTTNLRIVISWVECENGFTMAKKQFDGCLCQPTKTEK